MTDTITTDEFFKARAELRYKYFNQSDTLQFTTIPEFVTRDLEYIAKNLSDLYFFYYYFNPKSQNGNPSEFKTEIEQTIQKIINQEIEQPHINFQRIYKYFEELPSNIEDSNHYFATARVILRNQQTMKQLFAKYKDALLSLNQISNNQQLWI